MLKRSHLSFFSFLWDVVWTPMFFKIYSFVIQRIQRKSNMFRATWKWATAFSFLGDLSLQVRTVMQLLVNKTLYTGSYNTGVTVQLVRSTTLVKSWSIKAVIPL